jgi:hypothetical protein
MAAEIDPAVDPAAAQAPLPGSTRRAVAAVGAAMMAMNVFAYGFALLAAHALGPASFSAVSSLLGVLIVANVGSLTLQATVARRLATAPGVDLDPVRCSALATGRWMSLLVVVLLLGLVPMLDAALQLDDWLATAMVAPTAGALTMMGAYAGIAQGRRRWRPLAAIYVAMGAGRLLVGGIALAVDSSPRAAMIGVAVGSLAPLLVGWRLCSVGRERSGVKQSTVAELWRNGHALLAFFAFTNLDVPLARHLFPHHQAGLYAGGAIISKACLFLPTFVVVVAFPSMAVNRRGIAWLRPMGLVALLGGCVIGAALALPGLAESFAGGAKYAGLGHVAWVFALEGTVFAALQILVYDTIAAQTRGAAVLWLGVLALAILAVLFAHPVVDLAALAVATACGVGVLVAVLPRLRWSAQPGRASG